MIRKSLKFCTQKTKRRNTFIFLLYTSGITIELEPYNDTPNSLTFAMSKSQTMPLTRGIFFLLGTSPTLSPNIKGKGLVSSFKRGVDTV